MQQKFEAPSKSPSSELLKVLADLETYPHWLDLVDNVRIDDQTTEPAWLVTLRAKIGPIARSKVLRMVRKPSDTGITFERQEKDNRSYSMWRMTADIQPNHSSDSQSYLSVELLYDGPYWSPILDNMIKSRITKTIDRLDTYIKTRS